jgi:hypothetical protein
MTVFLYHANKLSRGLRREVEAAYDSDPKVRDWFEVYKSDEETKRPKTPKVKLNAPAMRQAMELGYAIATSHEEEATNLGRFRDYLAISKSNRLPDDGSAIFPSELMRRRNIPTGEASLDLSRPFGTEASKQREVHGISVEDNIIDVYQPEEAVPYGLVLIVASRGDVPLASTVRLMEHDQKTKGWRLKLGLDKLFDRDLVEGPVSYYAIPAQEEFFDLFPRVEVEAILKDIPSSWDFVRSRVEELLPLLN